jgi:hypothetical protein
MHSRIFPWLLFVFMPFEGATAAPRQVLPMQFYGTRPAVQVRVNGKGPFLFLIDTGAAGPAARADASLVAKLSLPTAGKTTSSDAGGAEVSIDKLALATVQVGSWIVRDVEALTRDYNGSTYLPHLDGILGLNFFKDRLVTLDYVHRRVIISSASLPMPDGKTVLSYELVDGNPAVRVMLGGQPKTVLVDTGDIRAIDVPTAWLPGMPLASFPRLAGNSSSISGSTPIREVKLALPLVLGQFRIEEPSVTFSDDFDAANLGSTLLRDFVVTFDVRNRRLELKKPRP